MSPSSTFQEDGLRDEEDTQVRMKLGRSVNVVDVGGKARVDVKESQVIHALKSLQQAPTRE